MTDVEDNKVSSLNGMNIFLIILAVFIVIVILAFISAATHLAATYTVIDALKNIFKFGKEYQLSDAFKIVN